MQTWMMPINKFNVMPIEDKAFYIWYMGKFISQREQNNHRIELYSIDSFFAEVWFKERNLYEKDNIIIKIITFNDTDYLTPYLEEIDISMINY